MLMKFDRAKMNAGVDPISVCAVIRSVVVWGTECGQNRAVSYAKFYSQLGYCV